MLRVIDKLFFLWVVLGFAIPFALGWIVGGGIGAALTAVLWGGFVRVFLLHHVTWSINSVCHFFGRRRFDVEDESRNVFWLAPLSMGEAWHHNHHAFPTSAFPRAAPLGAVRRPDRTADRAAREARDRLERRPGQPRAPARKALPRPASTRGTPRRTAYADSSGAIVSPAPFSCSQYCSASSRGPLQTIAHPLLWIRSANR